MSILTILLAFLLGGTGGSNVQLTAVSGNGSVTSSPFNVMGGGPTSVNSSSPIAVPTPSEVVGGGPTE